MEAALGWTAEGPPLFVFKLGNIFGSQPAQKGRLLKTFETSDLTKPVIWNIILVTV
jgi:hypothetical protein